MTFEALKDEMNDSLIDAVTNHVSEEEIRKAFIDYDLAQRLKEAKPEKLDVIKRMYKDPKTWLGSLGISASVFGVEKVLQTMKASYGGNNWITPMVMTVILGYIAKGAFTKEVYKGKKEEAIYDKVWDTKLIKDELTLKEDPRKKKDK